MTGRAKALALVGAAVAAGALAVGARGPRADNPRDVLVAEAVDAGCTAREYVCLTLAPDGGYAERPIHVPECPDGVRFVPVPAQVLGVHDLAGQCRRANAVPWVNFDLAPGQIRQGSCACQAWDAGRCNYTQPGRYNPGDAGNEYPPGTWSGPGCVPKPCGELAGLPNWPAQCSPPPGKAP